MRWMLIGVSVLVIGGYAAPLRADDETKRVVGGVISGLLGQPQQPSYTAQERDRLISLLQSGDYVTSRQGEPVDLMVYGVPLTQAGHVYTAKPIRPSATSAPQ
ncbi:MAG: hypothetical protein HY599_03100 [Candidatus Omnitrophica bacterium]|nr:hypothetical protein [Candidatus Omnitrophota bacterium]